MSFLGTSLLSYSSCSCISVCILLRILVSDCVLVSQSDMSSGVRMSVSHFVNMEFLSCCSVLILFCTCFKFHGNILFGVLDYIHILEC